MMLSNPPIDVEIENPDPVEEEDYDDDDIEEILAPAKRARVAPSTTAGSNDPHPEPGPSNATPEQRPTVIQSGKNQPEKVSTTIPESVSNLSTPDNSPIASTSSEGRAVPQSVQSPATLERVLNETPKEQTEEVLADMLSDSALTLPISGSGSTVGKMRSISNPFSSSLQTFYLHLSFSEP